LRTSAASGNRARGEWRAPKINPDRNTALRSSSSHQCGNRPEIIAATIFHPKLYFRITISTQPKQKLNFLWPENILEDAHRV